MHMIGISSLYNLAGNDAVINSAPLNAVELKESKPIHLHIRIVKQRHWLAIVVLMKSHT